MRNSIRVIYGFSVKSWNYSQKIENNSCCQPELKNDFSSQLRLSEANLKKDCVRSEILLLD